MQLIAPLVNGFADAPGGSATIYRRGTTVAATVYSDFQGKHVVTQHTLDSRGRLVRYCNEMVDVAVYDSTGATVAGPFTVAQQFSDTEIIHAHWTGTDYDTAASALNNPLTAQSMLDKLYASFGADDGKVLVGGAARNLKDVLLTGFIDVKGPTYGAKGDGVTNDTVVIQNAINAADVAGGGFVFFPPGTYIVNSLAIPSNVTLLGCGSGKSILSSSYASDTVLVASGQFYAQGLKFSTTSYGLLRFTGAVGNGTMFTSCAFALTSAATKTVEMLIGSLGFGGVLNIATFDGCEFIQTGLGGTLPLISNGAHIHGGAITYVSGRAFGGDYMSLTGVYIEYQGAGAGNLRSPAVAGTLQTLTGCVAAASAGGTLALNPGIELVEIGCTLVGTRNATSRFNQERESAVDTVSSAVTSYTPLPLTYSRVMVISSGASFQWNNPTGAASFDGYDLELWYKNTNAGAITPVLDTLYKGAPVAVASGSACGMRFAWNSTLGKYVQIGSTVAYAA